MVTSIIAATGPQYWHNEAGQLHREDGPAVIWADGSKFWYKDGKIHREDGPAIIFPDGTQRWWLNGERVDPLVVFISQIKG